MWESLNEVWTQIYANSWLYLYSILACVMIRWSWYLRDHMYSMTEDSHLEKEFQFELGTGEALTDECGTLDGRVPESMTQGGDPLSYTAQG